MKNLFLKQIRSLLSFIISLLKRYEAKVDHQLVESGVIYMKLESSFKSEDNSSATFIFSNPKLLSLDDALHDIFSIMKSHPIYKSLDDNLILFTTVEAMDSKGNSVGHKSLHEQWYIHKDMSVDDYLEEVESRLSTLSDNTGYSLDKFLMFRINLWSTHVFHNKKVKINKLSRMIVALRNDEKVLDSTPFTSKPIGTRSFHSSPLTLANKDISIAPKPIKKAPSISPIKKVPTKLKSFHTLDIETMEYKGNQHPVMVSFFNGIDHSKSLSFILPDHVYYNLDKLEQYIDSLWNDVFKYILTTCLEKDNIIFCHNLGAFDGYFIFDYLSKYYPKIVEAIVDTENRFITITLTINGKMYIFKDSARIFPVSLNELCKIFDLPGKVAEYQAIYNKFISLINPTVRQDLLTYGTMDSVCLYNALSKAQSYYYAKYHIDLADCLSLPSLALKIFRTNYLRFDIPILKSSQDLFIRRSYFGGATDMYHCYGRKVYYYDVNSLYPKAMCNPMPLNSLGYITKSRIDLMKTNGFQDFFGFLEVDIECPKTVLRPVLPYKYKGKTIYPQGKFSGVYFSEELKAVLPLGYKILKIHTGLEFSKAEIFNDYVNDLYSVKMNSSGSERWIAKLLLNSLYGIFGRRQELLETRIIDNSELLAYLATSIIKSIIPIDSSHTLLLIVDNINNRMISKLNLQVEGTIPKKRPVNSNVAIASAITAYARIEMIPYKIHPATIYTDTDSIITTEPLPSHLLGPLLGQMKDEMNGRVIKSIFK